MRKSDEDTANAIRREISLLSRFEADYKTEAGANLITLLENTIQNTIKEFTTKEVDKFDTDAKMVFFLASCRSKLQTLISLRDKYLNASVKKAELNNELNEILKERR